jgi:nucleoside phosphorylase
MREFDHVLGFENSVVFDCNSAGVAMACSITKVPFVSIKVVERRIDDKNNIDTYLNALKEYVNVGKAVVTCIGDIGRNEVISDNRGGQNE